MESHPQGRRARVLLTSVFGPYAQDDEFGSRSINPMELYHNQVTRAQGAFSLRMFHRSWGIMMIQAKSPRPARCSIFPPAKHSLANCRAPIRHRGHFVDHRERRQSARDVPHGARAVAAIENRGGRARRRDSWRRTHARRRPHREGRRHSWMRRYLGEDPTAPDPASRNRFGLRDCASWASACRIGGRYRGHHHSFGGLSDGMQFLHDIGVLRRQGQDHQFLRDRRRAVRSDVATWRRRST